MLIFALRTASENTMRKTITAKANDTELDGSGRTFKMEDLGKEGKVADSPFFYFSNEHTSKIPSTFVSWGCMTPKRKTY